MPSSLPPCLRLDARGVLVGTNEDLWTTFNIKKKILAGSYLLSGLAS